MRDFEITGNGILPEISFSDEVDFNGAKVIKMTAKYSDVIVPEKFTVTWHENNGGAFSVWAPQDQYFRALFPSWRNDVHKESRSCYGVPVYQHLSKAGNNVFTVALSDCTSSIEFHGGIEERTGKIRVSIDFFTYKTEFLKDYEVYIYCDDRKQYFSDSLNDVTKFWENCGLIPAYTPESAKRSLYSSWYSFQKGVNQEELLEQCKLGAEYGMKSVILDDGWQTPNLGGGDEPHAYLTAGDWEPCENKFPDMVKFVDDVHNLGMKMILWIGTPFMGKNSKVYDFFKGKLLHDDEWNNGINIPDVRYPEVRKWYADMLSDRLKRWNLDGFKLDFIDHFGSTGENPPINDGMDIKSITEATQALMSDIKKALTDIKPDVLIEFRMAYTGPQMLKSCNLMRVEDIAYGSMHNRVCGIDLRLLLKKTAVHSDMLMWDYEATTEEAADQFSNLLFIVPQISMHIDKLPESHKKMMKWYLKFIDDNRDVLLDGRLVPLYPEALYPAVYAQKDNKVIAALYAMNSFEVPDGAKDISIVNATGNEKLLIDNIPLDKNYEICNCMGEIINKGKISSKINNFNIPHNGFLFVK